MIKQLYVTDIENKLNNFKVNLMMIIKSVQLNKKELVKSKLFVNRYAIT